MSNVRTRLLLVAAATLAAAAASAATPAPGYAVASRWQIGGSGGWDYLAFDAAAQRLLVTRSDRVVVLDGASGRAIGEIGGLSGVHGVALAPDLHRGFASNGRGDSVTVFDTATLATLKTIPIDGHNPDAIVFDAPSARVFTFNGKSHDATVIDAHTDAVIATIALAGKPEFAVSDGAGRIYVNNEDSGELVAIDTAKASVVATWPMPGCEEPSGLALDAARQRLFSVCSNGRMMVTDASTGRHVATVAIGAGPDAVAYDAARRRVFSSNGEDGTLSVIAQDGADRYRVEATLPTQPSARTLALDPASGRVFLAAAEFGAVPAATAQQPKPRAPMQPESFRILVVAPVAGR